MSPNICFASVGQSSGTAVIRDPDSEADAEAEADGEGSEGADWGFGGAVGAAFGAETNSGPGAIGLPVSGSMIVAGSTPARSLSRAFQAHVMRRSAAPFAA